MSYAALEKQMQKLPEEYLEEVAEFVDYLLFKARKKEKLQAPSGSSSYFGCLAKPIDGLEVQRDLRNEWN